MSSDLRVLKRFTRPAQGEKSHFPRKNRVFSRPALLRSPFAPVEKSALVAGNPRSRSAPTGAAQG